MTAWSHDCITCLAPTSTYNYVLIKELYDHRRGRLIDRVWVPEESYLVDEYGLVPGRANTLLHHTRTEAVAVEDDVGIWIREARLITGIHIPGLVQVGTKLVSVAV